ncbi:MAG: formylglycine-generating enzyme family protein [Spirochaetota bacterium]
MPIPRPDYLLDFSMPSVIHSVSVNRSIFLLNDNLMNYLKASKISLLIIALSFIANTSIAGTESAEPAFAAAAKPGDTVKVTIGKTTADMICVNNSSSNVTFPDGYGDASTETLTKPFFMGKTEVTNAQFAEVLQWAYNKKKFSKTITDSNGINKIKAKYGEQELINFKDSDSKIHYSAGLFTVDKGFENHPVVCVTWHGAVIFCNWLTEMKDGGTANLVYSGIDPDWWNQMATVENASKTGYRLPSTAEWSFAAKYAGTGAGDRTDLVSQNVNGGAALLTPGLYWSKGAYPSGAAKAWDDVANENSTYAVFDTDRPAMVMSKAANKLGLFDMSGNAAEWSFTFYFRDKHHRNVNGGSYLENGSNVQVYSGYSSEPSEWSRAVGFRLAKTK